MSSLYDNVESSYLSAKKLGSRTIVGTVVDIREESVRNPEGKSETKHVLYLEGEPKGLVFNNTNVDALVKLAGTYDTDDIVRKGIKVELRVEPVSFGARKVDGIRLYPAEVPF